MVLIVTTLAKSGLTTVIGQDFDHSCAATIRKNGYKALEVLKKRFSQAQNISMGLSSGE